VSSTSISKARSRPFPSNEYEKNDDRVDHKDGGRIARTGLDAEGPVQMLHIPRVDQPARARRVLICDRPPLNGACARRQFTVGSDMNALLRIESEADLREVGPRANNEIVFQVTRAAVVIDIYARIEIVRPRTRIALDAETPFRTIGSNEVIDACGLRIRPFSRPSFRAPTNDSFSGTCPSRGEFELIRISRPVRRTECVRFLPTIDPSARGSKNTGSCGSEAAAGADAGWACAIEPAKSTVAMDHSPRLRSEWPHMPHLAIVMD
jgi:hypothetical protein